jgi:hypothetical protein
MTEHELRQICEREGVTLTRVERNPKVVYWYGYRRVTAEPGQGKTHSVYVVAQSKLATFTEPQLLHKLARIPRSHRSAEPFAITPLPGGAVKLSKAGKSLILDADDLAQLVS